MAPKDCAALLTRMFESGNPLNRNSFQSANHSDLRIEAACLTFNVHKAVVFSSCPKLKTLYDQQLPRGGSNTIELDTPYGELGHEFLRYCYGLDIDISTEPHRSLELEAFDLYRLAVKYDVTGLATMIANTMIKTIGQIDNLARVASIANTFYKSDANVAEASAVRRAFIRRAFALLPPLAEITDVDEGRGREVWSILTANGKFTEQLIRELERSQRVLAGCLKAMEGQKLLFGSAPAASLPEKDPSEEMVL
ncbi:Putative BTB/POZ domain-containing protein [Septoria linicola]|uniref:BTB/POZ domain-containing protein n=1 Tax=Septoria linicola TaxID=215465 RepID=A0A9Q9EP50_9PEZI|nr:Putative BTB/POZ domain-containing protein [Septoria linicola]